MCEEVDGFKRTFEADPDATFLDLHNAILESVGYPNDQMTSFFICNDRWERGQEVTLVEMGDSFDYENMTMEETRLSDLMTETQQRLVYVFDPLYDRVFFGSLNAIKAGTMTGVTCTEQKGKAPKQLKTEESETNGKKNKHAVEDDFDMEDFYGDSQYDAEDLDMEGFQDLSFDDGSMF